MPGVIPGDGNIPERVLQAGLAHTACTLLINAAQHVARSAMLAEAATAVALQQALVPGADKSWISGLEAAERTLQDAMTAFAATSKAAIGLVRDGEASGG